SLSALTGGFALPDEVPGLRLTGASVSVTPSTGEFTVGAHATAAWQLPFGGGDLTLTGLDLTVQRGGPAAPVSCALSLRGEGPVTIVDGLVFERFTFDYALTPEGDWSVSGSVSALVFDTESMLAASLEQRNGRRVI